MKFINARGESYRPASFLSFNDVLLRPQKSRFDSRNSPSINIGGSILDLEESDHYSLNLEVKYSIPIISANMDTVTGPTMAIEMNRLGGIGILHRFYKDLKVYAQDIVNVNNALGYVAFSVGIGQKWKDFINHLYKNHFTQYNQPSLLVCIDVAHGHMDGVREMIDHLQNMPSGIHSTIIAGNVATARGARDLVDAGAKITKVGIGGGSICSTRIVTGHGVPQLSAIMEVKEEIRNEAYIIADGGIKTSGDIVKALAAGADCVMIGSVLAGHEECPGEVSFGHKVYRGQSSRHFLNDLGKTDVAAEGEAVKIPFRGKVESTINELAGGIRSGFTYSGVGSISELQKNAEFIEITNHGWVESMPHAIHSGYEQVH